ncbi:MAG: hypothetical protein LUC45_06505, partial [Paraprevotella sp.]|nr:hypothetical protein [Paraprevotella sp.]
TYTDIENKFNIPIVDPEAATANGFLIAYPKLLGKMCKNLVKTCETSYDNGVTSTTNIYDYELDKDGYVTKVTESHTDSETQYFYSYVWE